VKTVRKAMDRLPPELRRDLAERLTPTGGP
jgi:actin-like ATPase involved in cell morphogenesis